MDQQSRNAVLEASIHSVATLVLHLIGARRLAKGELAVHVKQLNLLIAAATRSDA